MKSSLGDGLGQDQGLIQEARAFVQSCKEESGEIAVMRRRQELAALKQKYPEALGLFEKLEMLALKKANEGKGEYTSQVAKDDKAIEEILEQLQLLAPDKKEAEEKSEVPECKMFSFYLLSIAFANRMLQFR